MLLLREALGPRDDLRLERERRLQRGGQVAEPAQPVRFLLRSQPAVLPREREREQEQRHQLRRERLGRRDADLRAGARQIGKRRLPDHRGRGDVADGERARMAERLRVLERGQRVRGLARLRDDDDKRRRIRHALAVAILARDLDRAPEAGDRLDPLLRDQCRVIAGPAGEKQHRVDSAQHGVGVRAEQPRIDAIDAFERVGHGARLLEDLLLHEMPVGPELHGSTGGLDRDDRPLDALAARVVDRPRLATYVGDVAVFEVGDAARHREQRRSIGGEEMVVGADADDERAPGARADDAPRLARRHHRDRVRAVKLRHRLLDRAQEVAAAGAVPVRVHEMRDHLGVGLRDERVALPHEPLAQRLEVLDDAVVHDGDLAVRRMRVRIGRRRRAVRRPARVRDSGQALDPRRLGLRGEIRDPGRRDEPREARRAGRSVDDGEPGGVVAAVFEPADAVDQDRNHVARRGRADDAAHGWVTFRCAAGARSRRPP